jgi:hypothetical protein
MGLSWTIPSDYMMRTTRGNNIRKHIGPRCVSSEPLEDIIKMLENLDAVRLQAATNAKVDTEAAKADAVEHDAHSGGPLHAEEWDILPEPLLGGGRFLEQ